MVLKAYVIVQSDTFARRVNQDAGRTACFNTVALNCTRIASWRDKKLSRSRRAPKHERNRALCKLERSYSGG